MRIKLVSLLLISSLCYSFKAQQNIRALSWNLHLLPSVVYWKTKKKLRVDSISNYLTKTDTTFQVLLFQEVFHKKRRKQLIRNLSSIYPFHTQVINQSIINPLKTNSGLIIFSKTPFKEVKHIKFDDCSRSDCMAFKGAQLIKLTLSSHKYYFINTHLNSEPPRSIALEQIQHIKDSLISPLSNEATPIILGGDFNINIRDTTNYQAMLKTLETQNNHHLELVSSDNIQPVSNTLDYFFIYNDDAYQNDIKHVLKFSIGPDWTNSNHEKIYGKTVGFSDHHPVMIELIQK